MKMTSEKLLCLSSKIAETETKLEILSQEIHQIGLPAGEALQNRLDALTIEERALKRNVEELLSDEVSDEGRRWKIEALLGHIETEEAALEKEAEFLHSGAPSSVVLVAQAGARLVKLCKRAIHRVLGNHHPLGSSVFVNHTHDELVELYGLKKNE